MIIGIDIRMLSSENRTGIEEYTYQVVRNMISLDKTIEFKLFYNGYKKTDLKFDWINRSNVKIFQSRIPNRLLDNSIRFFDFPKIEKIIGRVDKFFSPHIFLSSNRKDCEKIVTFHDLSFERYPEFYSRGKNFWHFSMNPRKQAEEANKIIAVSQSTKEDLIDLYKVNPEKIKVIYEGVNDKLFDKISEENLKNVRNKYNLPKKYILYLGTLEPRKNISSLIKAFKNIKDKKIADQKEMKLVIAGTKGWLYKDIFKTTQELEMNQDVIFTNFIDEKDKLAIYEMATIFAYPSFYEGFGLPPLEAMAKGVPVITSNISSIPEAVQNSAIIINPYKADEISLAIEKILEDDRLKEKLINKGKEEIKKFKWENCAEKTLEYIIK